MNRVASRKHLPLDHSVVEIEACEIYLEKDGAVIHNWLEVEEVLQRECTNNN